MEQEIQQLEQQIQQLKQQIEQFKQQVDRVVIEQSDMKMAHSLHQHRGHDGTKRLSVSSMSDFTSDYSAFATYYIRVNSDGKGLHYSAT